VWEDGRAVYLERQSRKDGSVWLHFDPDARWGYFRATKAQVNPNRPNIWVATKKFRMDYLLEEGKLTEMDKTGVQRTLPRRENSCPSVEPPESRPAQAGADQPGAVPESRSERIESPEPESEERPR
jgi:hypothetical protein